MKYLFFIFSFITTASFGQNFQIGIKAGSISNSVKISMRPLANRNNSQLSAYQLTVLIPSTISPRPTMSVLNNPIAGITPIINTSTETLSDGGFYVYEFDAVGTATVPIVNYVAGTEYDLLELAITGGPLATTAQVRAAQLPNGGVAGTSPGAYNNYLEIDGNDLTNVTAMFYGPGATNNPAGYTAYSYVPIGNISLPVKFLSFFALKRDDNANLTWTVESEENSAYYDVQRSLDGRNFTDIARVNTLRNGQSSNTYTTPDANISRLGKGIIYYRIKQTETNGDFIYSEIRQINLDKKNSSISIYPNPVLNSTKLLIDALDAGNATVIIRDVTGKTVQQLNLQLVKGVNQQVLNTALLAAGEYNVTIVGEKLNQTIKMTKTK